MEGALTTGHNFVVAMAAGQIVSGVKKLDVREFGKPLVNSMFTVALVVGISVLESTHGTTIANLGFDQVLFPKPLFYGDTVRVESEVISARASRSRPTQGIVTFEHRAFNQNGDLVCKARRNALMKKNPSKC